MADRCSVLSFEELKKSGQLGKAQAMYLQIFMECRAALTHKNATWMVNDAFSSKMPARNGRIAELEQLGFLKKHDTVIDRETKKRVNRWIWTGRTTPFESKPEWIECSHCEGKGGRMELIYYAPPRTVPPDLFP